MPGSTIIDKLVTILGFESDLDSLKKFDSAVRRTKDRLNSLSTGALVVGGALTAVGGVTLRTVLGYEQAFNELAATYLDAPTEAIASLREQSQRLGATTSKTASDVVAAQTAIARAGFAVNETLAITPHVLNLAIAGNLSMAEAAGIVTSQLAAYGLEADQTARLTDVLAATANAARTNVRELGPAFRQVAPLAATANVSLEQTAALLGTLRSGGLRPEQAGTALRNILAIMQEEPTPAIKEALEAMGVSFETLRARASGGDIIGAMGMLRLAGLDTATALEIFGREAATGALILTNASGDVRQLTTDLEGAQGTADEMRVVMESGLPGGVAQFRSALEGAQLALGDSGLTGAFSSALEKATGFLKWLRNADGWIKTFVTSLLIAGPVLLGLGIFLRGLSFALGGYSAAVTTATVLTRALRSGTLLLRVQLFALAVQQKAAAIGSLLLRGAHFAAAAATGVLKAAQWALNIATNALSISNVRLLAMTVATRVGMVASRVVMLAGAVATGIMTAAQWALNVALTANPVGLIIVGIVALIAILGAAAYVVYKFRAQIWEFVQKFLAWFRDLPLPVKILIAVLGGPIGAIIAIIAHLGQLRDFFVSIFNAIVDFIESLDFFELGKNIVQRMIDGILSVGGGIKDAIGGAFGGISKLLPGSDADEGPLSRLTDAGRSIIETMNAGIRQAGNLDLASSLLPGLNAGIDRIGNLDLASSLLPVGPVPPPVAAGGGGITLELTIERIEINAAGGNPEQIAAEIGDQLRQQIRQLVEEVDTQIRA